MIQNQKTKASLRNLRSLAVVAILSLPMLGGTARSAGAVVIAEELIVDLRAADLDATSSTWVNQATSTATVGNFSTKGGGNLNVVGIDGISKALRVEADLNQSVISALNAPISLLGNNTRTVEIWMYSSTVSGTSTPVSWGVAPVSFSDHFLSSFRTNDTANNGMFSSWANDAGWGEEAIETGEWVYYVWTWDGTTIRGYRNGVLINSKTLSALATADARITIGAERNGVTGAVDGYIADVRIHTGVLSDADILNNFHEGIYAIPEARTVAMLITGSLILIARRVGDRR